MEKTPIVDPGQHTYERIPRYNQQEHPDQLQTTSAGRVLGSSPESMTCHKCGQHIVTRTESKVSVGECALCTLLFIIICCGLCLIIPLSISDRCAARTGAKDTLHYCPSCNTFLGGS